MLARKLLSNLCANLIDFLKEIINSENFLICHRQNPTDFVRQRKLTFSTLIFFLINFVKGSYQDELDHFFKSIHCLDVARDFVSKAAFAKARMKLKYDAFIELNLRLIHFFYDNFTVSKWNGFNLLAVDDTTGQLPRIEAIAEHFGAWYPRQGGEYAPWLVFHRCLTRSTKSQLMPLLSPKVLENVNWRLSIS